MTLIAWIGLVTLALVAAGVAVFTGCARRRRIGTLLTVGGVGALLTLRGTDLLATAWLLVMVPVAAAMVPTPGGRDREPRQPLATLAGGVLATLAFAVLYLVVLQVDWQSLSAALPEAQVAEVAGRILTVDAALILGLGLALVVVAVDPRSSAAEEETP